MLAGGFCLVLLESRKPCTKEHLVALLNAFGERVCSAKPIFSLPPAAFQPLLGFLLVRQSPDLNDPSATQINGRFGRCRRSRHRAFSRSDFRRHGRSGLGALRGGSDRRGLFWWG